jgi:hypothetical protein
MTNFWKIISTNINMQTTRNKFTEEQRKFLTTLGTFVGSPFYYFGSIQRSDYIVGKSDIDIDIFSYQPEKMAKRLLHLLSGPYVSIKRILFKFDGNEVSGFKVKYKRPSIESSVTDIFKVEFSVYNEKDKNLILEKHRKQIFISPYISAILFFMKLLFKNIGLYHAVKKQLLSRNDTFISLPY